MICSKCKVNETDSSSGICWQCAELLARTVTTNTFLDRVEEKAVYPKMPRELNATVKLTVRGIIRILYNDVGVSQRGLGRLFGVDKSTIGAYLKTPEENRNKRYRSPSYGKVRENPKRRKERREIFLDKYLQWERKVGLYKRETERIRKNKTRKKLYHPILLLRNEFERRRKISNKRKNN